MGTNNIISCNVKKNNGLFILWITYVTKQDKSTGKGSHVITSFILLIGISLLDSLPSVKPFQIKILALNARRRRHLYSKAITISVLSLITTDYDLSTASYVIVIDNSSNTISKFVCWNFLCVFKIV